VTVDDPHGGLDISAFDGLDDRGVPVAVHHGRLPTGAVEDGHAHPALETLPYLDQHRVTRQLAQEKVEAEIGLHPGGQVAAGVGQLR
jgi:hypothetical protein